MQERFLEAAARARGSTPEAVHEARLKLVPLGRTSPPRECAETILWLLSPAAGYLTGPADRRRRRPDDVLSDERRASSSAASRWRRTRSRPGETTLDDLRAQVFGVGADLHRDFMGPGSELAGAWSALEDAGYEPVPSLATWAGPGPAARSGRGRRDLPASAGAARRLDRRRVPDAPRLVCRARRGRPRGPRARRAARAARARPADRREPRLPREPDAADGRRRRRVQRLPHLPARRHAADRRAGRADPRRRAGRARSGR